MIAEMSFVVIFYLLCQEDYNWWWKVVFVGSLPGFFVALQLVAEVKLELSAAKVVWSFIVGTKISWAGAGIAIGAVYWYVKVIFKK
jgi:hypothetical protein